jgi:hypothetical protein
LDLLTFGQILSKLLAGTGWRVKGWRIPRENRSSLGWDGLYQFQGTVPKGRLRIRAVQLTLERQGRTLQGLDETANSVNMPKQVVACFPEAPLIL